MTTATKETAQKSERKTITIDLTDHSELWEMITKRAAADERTAAQYVRRYLAANMIDPAPVKS
jgi:hypothetical protein